MDFKLYKYRSRVQASLKREHSRTEECEEGTHVVIWGRGEQVEGRASTKGPEVEECLVCLK